MFNTVLFLFELILSCIFQKKTTTKIITTIVVVVVLSLQSSLCTKTTLERTKKLSLEAGGLRSQVNLFFISVSGTHKM